MKRPRKPIQTFSGHWGMAGVDALSRSMEDQSRKYRRIDPQETGPHYDALNYPLLTQREARQLEEAQNKILRRRAGPSKIDSHMVMAGQQPDKPRAAQPDPRRWSMLPPLTRAIPRSRPKKRSK
jgi:hypothetical protein